ncbi:MAG: TonB-dependent receptor [bacterium]|nr:TonB-dependent receptor [bacterium]
MPILGEDQKESDKYFKMSVQELLDVELYTAGKTLEKIGDIPASVVLITREDIETYGYQSLIEILENIPGLFAIDDYDENSISFGVRGFWSGVANDNMIILVNGVQQLNDLFSNYPLTKILAPVESIDRIEVIRGPMSVIYGQGAFYGVINIITDDQVKKPVSMVSSSIGSLNTKKLFARVTGSKGGFYYFFDASMYDTNGIDKPLIDMVVAPLTLTGLNVPLDSRTRGRLENNEKYLNFSGTFNDFSVNFSYNESGKEFYTFFPSVADGSVDNITAARLSFGYRNELSKKLTVEGRFSYSQIRDSLRYDQLFEDFYGIQETGTNAWEAEVNTYIKPHPNLNITTGFYYRSVLTATNMFDLPSFGIPALENNHISLRDGDDIVTRALFVQADYNPKKNLRLVAGVRLEQSPKYGLEKIQTFGTEPPVKVNGIYDRDNVEVIPRFAVIYHFNDRNTVKFLYGEAINRPSFFQNYLNTLLSNSPQLEPESIQTLELNYTGLLLRRISINASMFRNTLNNLITRIIVFDENNNYESWSGNAGKMVTHGMELTLNAEPVDHFRIELSGTFQKTRDKRAGFEDIDVAYSPELLGYLKAAYRAETFSLALTGNYVGPMETFWDETRLNPDGSFGNRIGERVDGYFVLGANLRFRNIFAKGPYLNIRCSNLLDTEIRYPTFTNNEWADRGTIGNGRTFLVTIGKKF